MNITTPILAAAGLLVLCFPAWADSVGTARDYAILLPGGAFILVVFAMLKGHDCVERDEDLRSRFPCSGLYACGEERKPVWTIDWYDSARPLSDGIHLVRWGPWPESGQFEELAVAFYRSGMELARYRIDELVAEPERLETTVSHFRWLADDALLEDERILWIRTLHGEEYRFCTKTGRIESARGVDSGVPLYEGYPAEHWLRSLERLLASNESATSVMPTAWMPLLLNRAPPS